VIRIDPEWADPFVALGTIYHRRREWKPAFHYWKKALALDADDREAWWHLGLAAVGLNRMRVARSVWDKFGFGKTSLDKPLALEIRQPEAGYEIIWMQPLDAGRCRILSIPHPGSGLRYRDTMLYDRRAQTGTNVVAKRRVPIFRSLSRLKRSPYQTFSCLLHTSSEAKIRQLEQLCFDAGLGFEVWSNASRTTRINRHNATEKEKNSFPEYYNDLVPRPDHGKPTVLRHKPALHRYFCSNYPPLRKFAFPLLVFFAFVALCVVVFGSYRSGNAGKLLAEEYFTALPAGGYGTQRALRPVTIETNDAAILDQGILYHQQQEYDRALVSLRAYLDDRPVTDDYLPGFLASTAAFATGRYAESQEYIQSMQRSSRSAKAAFHWQSALLELRQEELTSAHHHLEQVVSLDSTGYAAGELLLRVAQVVGPVVRPGILLS